MKTTLRPRAEPSDMWNVPGSGNLHYHNFMESYPHGPTALLTKRGKLRKIVHFPQQHGAYAAAMFADGGYGKWNVATACYSWIRPGVARYDPKMTRKKNNKKQMKIIQGLE